MKLKYTILGICLLGLSSCFKDEGNYDYRKINEIKVIGGMEEEYSAYTMVDTLRITPELSFTQDAEAKESYEYSWYLAKSNVESGKVEKISDKLNLEYLVTQPKGFYVLTLGVKDKETGVEWQTDARLEVTTIFTNGWLMLGEREGIVSLDMVSVTSIGDTTVVRDILKNSGLPALHGPRKMVSVNRYNNNPCVIMTDDGTFELDKVNMTSDESTNIRYNIYDPMAGDDFAASDMIQYMGYNRQMIGDNSLYVTSISLISPSVDYGNPINKYEKYSDEYFKVWPEIIYGFSSWGSYAGSQIVYDMDGKRFAKYTHSSANCEALTDGENEPWSWETGNDMVAIFNSQFLTSGAQTSYAVMKSPDGKFYLYSMTPSNTKKGKRYDISQLPDIAQADKFIFSSKYPYMLYAAGSKLYACEFLDSGVTHKELDGFGTDAITMLYYDSYKERGKDYFYIATYNDAQGGTVQKYQIADNPNDIVIEPIEGSRWDDLCKVTSMCWKWY